MALLAATMSGCAPEPSPFVPLADVKELMESVVEPAAEVYWDAVGIIMDESGTTEIAPQTDEEWLAVRNAAVVIAESGNLLMMEGRILGAAEWIASARALIDVGRLARDAADARDTAAVFDAGAEVYFVCSDCHATYAPGTLRPNDVRGVEAGR